MVCGKPARLLVRDVIEGAPEGAYRTFTPGDETREFCDEHMDDPRAKSRMY